MHPRDFVTATATMASSSVEDATRLRAIIEALPVSVARVGSEGTILALNDAAFALVGVDHASEALQHPFTRFIARSCHADLNAFVARVCWGEPGTVEIDGCTASGVERTLELTAAPLPVDEQGRRSALIVLRDVGARRALEIAALALNDRAHEDATLLAERSRTIDNLQRRLSEAESTPAVPVAAHPTDLPFDTAVDGGNRADDTGDAVVRQDHAPGLSEANPRSSAQSVTARVVDTHGSAALERSTLRARIEALEAALDSANAGAEAQARLAQESETERVAILRTAEYLETQRSRLAAELRQALERTEEARVALVETHAAHEAQLADARQAAARLVSRLDSLEAAHAQALAGHASLQLEVDRLREVKDLTVAEAGEGHASAESDLDALKAELGMMQAQYAALEGGAAEKHAECSGLKEALKDALADFEDLTTWGKAKSSLLAQAIRGQAGPRVAKMEGLDGHLD